MIDLLWNVPLSEAKLNCCIKALELQPGQRVLDVGCGCGEALIRICERFQVQGTGIDLSQPHIAEARRRAAGRVAEAAVRFVESDARSYDVVPSSFDLVMCLGATHAFGLGKDACRNTIAQITPLVVPGGLVLVADGYLKQPAAPAYRALLGDSLPDEMTHAFHVGTGRELGLIPLAAWTSNEDEWDDFEWSYQRIVEQNAVRRPDDREAQAKLLQRRTWIDAYVQWGRDTLGFGVYLFKRPT